jgi:putative transposase
MTLKQANHSTYDTHYHIVFPVKYRKALLTNGIPQAIREIAYKISQRYDIDFETIGTDGDHIHLLCNFKPSYSGADVVRIFKSITARELFKQYPELRKELWKGELWSDGYYFSTIGEKGGIETIRQYVANQGKTIQPSQISLFD